MSSEGENSSSSASVTPLLASTKPPTEEVEELPTLPRTMSVAGIKVESDDCGSTYSPVALDYKLENIAKTSTNVLMHQRRDSLTRRVPLLLLLQLVQPRQPNRKQIMHQPA